MNQQVTYRVGRGPRAITPAPARSARLWGTVFDASMRSVFYMLALTAIILTVGVNQFTPH